MDRRLFSMGAAGLLVGTTSAKAQGGIPAATLALLQGVWVGRYRREDHEVTVRGADIFFTKHSTLPNATVVSRTLPLQTRLATLTNIFGEDDGSFTFGSNFLNIASNVAQGYSQAERAVRLRRWTQPETFYSLTTHGMEFWKPEVKQRICADYCA